jgi:tight adherence protein B
MGLILAAMLVVLLGGGAVMALAGGNDRSKARVAALTKPDARLGKTDPGAQRKRNMQAALKEFEKKQAEKKPTITLRRRLDQAGLFETSPRTFWLASGGFGLAVALLCLVEQQGVIVVALAGFAAGLGLPRWVLGFLKRRREKKFTADFANAIDVIVRSVKSGLPTSDALGLWRRSSAIRSAASSRNWSKASRSGSRSSRVSSKMYESMPTTEVSFFGIVMTIQQKTGGNLSEALGNLAGVLRDRRRLHRQDQGDVVRGQGVGADHRLAAARRGDHRLLDDAGLYLAAVHRADGQSAAGRLRHLDGARHHGHEENDQLQALRGIHVRRYRHR